MRRFAAFFSAVLLVFSLAACGKNAETGADVSKYLSFEYEGYSGAGTATVKFDIATAAGEIEDSLVAEAAVEAGKVEFDALKTEPFYGLSNGDEVQVVWDDAAKEAIYGALGMDATAGGLAFKDVKVKVEGLEETDAELFDPFDYVSMTYSGSNGSGEAKLEILEPDPMFYYITFTMDKHNELSNGDVITVTADLNALQSLEEYSLENDMLPITVTKEYTVEGLT